MAEMKPTPAIFKVVIALVVALGFQLQTRAQFTAQDIQKTIAAVQMEIQQLEWKKLEMQRNESSKHQEAVTEFGRAVASLQSQLSLVQQNIVRIELDLGKRLTSTQITMLKTDLKNAQDRKSKLEESIAKAQEPKPVTTWSDGVAAQIATKKKQLADLQQELNQALLKLAKPSPPKPTPNSTPSPSTRPVATPSPQQPVWVAPTPTPSPVNPNGNTSSSLGQSAPARKYTRPNDEYYDERDLVAIPPGYLLDAPLPPNNPVPGNVYGVNSILYDQNGYLIEFKDEAARQEYIRETAALIKEDNKQRHRQSWLSYYEMDAREKIFHEWQEKFRLGAATLKDHPGYGRGGGINSPGDFTVKDWIRISKRLDEQKIRDLGGRKRDVVSDTLAWVRLAEDQQVRFAAAWKDESKQTFFEHMDWWERRNYDSLREGLTRLNLSDNPPYKWENWEDEKLPPKSEPAPPASSATVPAKPDSSNTGK